MDSQEIKIQPKKIEVYEEELTTLATTLRSYQSDITFSVAQGEALTELCELSQSLNALNEEVALLMEKTSAILRATRVYFQETDETVAVEFQS